MKVWTLIDHYDETSVYSGDTVVAEIPYVKEELSYLVGGYDDELKKFHDNIANAIRRGRGSASIEERFTIVLTDLR